MTQPRALAIEPLENRRLLAINPTPIEQEYIQLVNRFRVDPTGEFSRLISQASPIKARDPIFQLELDAFGVNGNSLRSELQSLSPVPPVGWSEGVQLFTASHNLAMINSNPPSQFHSDSLVRRQQLLANGVNLRFASGELVSSENVYGFAKSPVHLFAGYVVDWGNGPGGMQVDRPHRRSLMNDQFEQMGSTITSFGGANFGPLVNTHVLVNIEAPPAMVVGALFEDENSSDWYEAGEGIGGASITFSGTSGTFTTQSLSAGGYQIELPAGTYTAIATGGGMKHPVVRNNIVVASTNVWANLIYDPDAIPPDGSEPNNSLGAATALTGRDQTLTNRSIHLPSDVDFYRLQPQSTGNATIRIQFNHSAGNLDLQLLNASGAVMATSNSGGNTESISTSVVRDTTYFVRVYSAPGGVNGNYSLSIDAPEPQAAIANPDHATVSNLAPTTSLPILANDTDPDGDHSKLVPTLAANTPNSFTLDSSTNRVHYTAQAGFSGFQRTSYTLKDDQGLTSPPASISVFVVNFDDPTPWQNNSNPVDVNDDQIVSGLDALLIINEINARSARQLPQGGDVSDILGFLDTSGNGFVSALDVLQVVNAVNNAGNGEGEERGVDVIPRSESSHANGADAHDEALWQLMSASFFAEELHRGRKRR